jgi:hypothetical protein
VGRERRPQGTDESRCEACDQPVIGIKVATEDLGILCVRCARDLLGFDARTGDLGKRGKGKP